ncbi:unnamed protein product, partial [Prorocentrum cordatum]
DPAVLVAALPAPASLASAGTVVQQNPEIHVHVAPGSDATAAAWAAAEGAASAFGFTPCGAGAALAEEVPVAGAVSSAARQEPIAGKSDLAATLPDGRYSFPYGTRLRRFALEQAALEGYEAEAAKHEAPSPAPVFDLLDAEEYECELRVAELTDDHQPLQVDVSCMHLGLSADGGALAMSIAPISKRRGVVTLALPADVCPWLGPHFAALGDPRTRVPTGDGQLATVAFVRVSPDDGAWLEAASGGASWSGDGRWPAARALVQLAADIPQHVQGHENYGGGLVPAAHALIPNDLDSMLGGAVGNGGAAGAAADVGAARLQDAASAAAQRASAAAPAAESAGGPVLRVAVASAREMMAWFDASNRASAFETLGGPPPGTSPGGARPAAARAAAAGARPARLQVMAQPRAGADEQAAAAWAMRAAGTPLAHLGSQCAWPAPRPWAPPRRRGRRRAPAPRAGGVMPLAATQVAQASVAAPALALAAAAPAAPPPRAGASPAELAAHWAAVAALQRMPPGGEPDALADLLQLGLDDGSDASGWMPGARGAASVPDSFVLRTGTINSADRTATHLGNGLACVADLMGRGPREMAEAVARLLLAARGQFQRAAASGSWPGC